MWGCIKESYKFPLSNKVLSILALCKFSWNGVAFSNTPPLPLQFVSSPTKVHPEYGYNWGSLSLPFNFQNFNIIFEWLTFATWNLVTWSRISLDLFWSRKFLLSSSTFLPRGILSEATVFWKKNRIYIIFGIMVISLSIVNSSAIVFLCQGHWKQFLCISN